MLRRVKGGPENNHQRVESDLRDGNLSMQMETADFGGGSKIGIGGAGHLSSSLLNNSDS